MVLRASLLLAFSLVCIESKIASPCKPGTTSTALTSSSETAFATSHSPSSTTVVTTDSTTSGSSTDSTTASLTVIESSTDSTTFLSTTSSAPVISDSKTLSISEVTISATSTSPQPDSTPFNIIPGAGSAASGFLKVRIILGGEVYFNNQYTTYQTGVFVVNGATRRLVERGSQSICAFFRTGRDYGDLNGCQPEVNPDVQQVPINCQLTGSEELECSVPGKFCCYQGEFLTCDDRGTYSSLYIGALSGAGYGVIIGPSGLSFSSVELAATPIETQ